MNAVFINKQNEQSLKVRFPYDASIVEKLRLVSRRRWDPQEKVWIIPYTLENVMQIITIYHDCRPTIGADLLAESKPLHIWLHSTNKNNTYSHKTDSQKRE